MGSIPADGWIRLGLSNRARGETGQTGAEKGAKRYLATGAIIRPFSVVHESALAVNAWRWAGGASASLLRKGRFLILFPKRLPCQECTFSGVLYIGTGKHRYLSGVYRDASALESYGGPSGVRSVLIRRLGGFARWFSSLPEKKTGTTHYCENPLPQKGAECAKETFLSFLRFLRLSFIIQGSLELGKSELHPEKPVGFFAPIRGVNAAIRFIFHELRRFRRIGSRGISPSRCNGLA